LSICAATPRSIIERRLAAVLHRHGADAASPPWLRSSHRPHDMHRERSTQHWNPTWLRPISQLSPVWQQTMQRCASGPRAKANPLTLDCFPNFLI
jgi:hypothetical protein